MTELAHIGKLSRLVDLLEDEDRYAQKYNKARNDSDYFWKDFYLRAAQRTREHLIWCITASSEIFYDEL